MNKIINFLQKKKSLPLDQFIELSLYDKKYGYYMKKNPFGKNGDFITSPLISNIFSEMIAIWCVLFWEHLGKPKKIVIVELGPGDASLCKDILNTFKNFKDFYSSLEIKLLEKSIRLKKIQQSKIKNKKVSWVNNINEINYGPIIFLGNEFFDSLPIKQILKKKNTFFEKHVALNKDQKKIKYLLKKAKKDLIKKILDLNLVYKGNLVEYPIVAIKYLEIIAKRLKKYGGGILTFDYGYTKPKNKNTLQSISKHKYTNIFYNPGNVDITSHINYKLFSEILIRNGLEVEKVVSQSEFLQKVGIIERANILSKNKSFKVKADIFYKLKKLLDLNEMGNLFKVLFAKKRGGKFSLGFN